MRCPLSLLSSISIILLATLSRVGSGTGIDQVKPDLVAPSFLPEKKELVDTAFLPEKKDTTSSGSSPGEPDAVVASTWSWARWVGATHSVASATGLASLPTLTGNEKVGAVQFSEAETSRGLAGSTSTSSSSELVAAQFSNAQLNATFSSSHGGAQQGGAVADDSVGDGHHMSHNSVENPHSDSGRGGAQQGGAPNTVIVSKPNRRLRGIHTLSSPSPRAMIVCIGLMCALSIVGYMMPGGGGGADTSSNYRVPPRWSPDQERSGYTFRNYVTDLSLWVMLTDLAPHQQAAAIVMRLGGAARDLARTISPQELMHGGVVDGVQLDPVSLVAYGLH